jgi:hypothetical protein
MTCPEDQPGADKSVRRGFHPDDRRLFTGQALARLLQARQEIEWLLDRGYQAEQVLDLVGGHYQLTVRQRTALARVTAASGRIAHRQATCLPVSAGGAGCLHLDGFNLIITLETALSGSLLLLGSDGALRDLAGLRGTYRLIGETDRAIGLIGQSLQRLGVPAARIYLDAPVSNSGRLRQRIQQLASDWTMPVDVELTDNPDRILATLPRVVSSDSAILDCCPSWYNLARLIVAEHIPQAWIVSFQSDWPA